MLVIPFWVRLISCRRKMSDRCGRAGSRDEKLSTHLESGLRGLNRSLTYYSLSSLDA
jgi:hypothetical protein